MSNNYATDKASDLMKTTGRALNAEQRLAAAEALKEMWVPEFKIINDESNIFIQCKIGGKVTLIPLVYNLLERYDAQELAKLVSEEFMVKFAALTVPLIAVETDKAIKNYSLKSKKGLS